MRPSYLYYGNPFTGKSVYFFKEATLIERKVNILHVCQYVIELPHDNLYQLPLSHCQLYIFIKCDILEYIRDQIEAAQNSINSFYSDASHGGKWRDAYKKTSRFVVNKIHFFNAQRMFLLSFLTYVEFSWLFCTYSVCSKPWQVAWVGPIRYTKGISE